jgi:hypothetical protein
MAMCRINGGPVEANRFRIGCAESGSWPWLDGGWWRAKSNITTTLA